MTSLSIIKTPLEHIPHFVSQLTTLKQLHINGNRLQCHVNRLPDNYFTNLTALTSLSIVNTSLKLITRSVCQLTALDELNLDDNRLTRLPDNCFTNLAALTSLTVSRNYITELQDGVFDGLHRLKRLELTENQISSIGSGVFNSYVMLNSLFYVDLSRNKLTTLEPWFYFVSVEKSAFINLSWNVINVKFRCGMENIHARLDFGGKKMDVISGFLKGRKIILTSLFCMTTTRNSRSALKEDFIGNLLDCNFIDFRLSDLITAAEFTKNKLPIYDYDYDYEDDDDDYDDDDDVLSTVSNKLESLHLKRTLSGTFPPHSVCLSPCHP